MGSVGYSGRYDGVAWYLRVVFFVGMAMAGTDISGRKNFLTGGVYRIMVVQWA